MIGSKLLGGTDLTISELCLGTNPFGWTADEHDAFEVLDAFAAAGGNFLDTADSYSAWAEGNSGGEAETVIGHWIARRGRSDDLVVATKVGSLGGLSAGDMRACLDASLRRLGIEHIDLYYAHKDDPETPLEETLATFDEFVRSGKVRHVGISNYDPPRLSEALAIVGREGFAPLVAMTPHYNLLERGYEATLAPILVEHEISSVPYYGLAKGFLTGKYRAADAAPSSRGRLDGSAYVKRARPARTRHGRADSGRARHDGIGRRAGVAGGAADRGGADRECTDDFAARGAAPDGRAGACRG